MLHPLLVDLRQKIAQHKGEEMAQSLIADALSRAGLKPQMQYSQAEMMRFSEALAPAGGIVELLARSLKLRVLLATPDAQSRV